MPGFDLTRALDSGKQYKDTPEARALIEKVERSRTAKELLEDNPLYQSSPILQQILADVEVTPEMRKFVRGYLTEGKSAFGSLPKKGRIPLATAKRALNRLGRKAKACGITPALLREGMEIEREHRDITGGRVLQTAKIAAAHICERPDYYKRIKRFVER